MKETAAVRWGAPGYGDCIEIFTAGDTQQIFRNDPRFADLMAVLTWIPAEDEVMVKGGDVIIKWWDSIPLETISHLVKKT